MKFFFIDVARMLKSLSQIPSHLLVMTLLDDETSDPREPLNHFCCYFPTYQGTFILQILELYALLFLAQTECIFHVKTINKVFKHHGMT